MGATKKFPDAVDMQQNNKVGRVSAAVDEIVVE
jgi:hypothetical protein